MPIATCDIQLNCQLTDVLTNSLTYCCSRRYIDSGFESYWVHDHILHLFCTPILFAIFTATFIKLYENIYNGMWNSAQ
jgi:hypothetical protein